MKTREEALTYGLSFPDTYQDAPFHDPNWQLVRVKGSKKAFLWTYEREGWINLNVKANPEWRDFWRSTFPSVIPGWHQNKEYWNTIILDGSIPKEDIKRMIAESYELVTDSPSKRIYEAVKQIPRGKVATYGKVAELAGNKKMARAVGNALHRNPDPETIPCYRVVNAKGELAGEFVDSQWDNYSICKVVFRELLEECFGVDEDDDKMTANNISPDRIYHNKHIKKLINMLNEKDEKKAHMQLMGTTMSLVGLRQELCFVLKIDDPDFSTELVSNYESKSAIHMIGIENLESASFWRRKNETGQIEIDDLIMLNCTSAGLFELARKNRLYSDELKKL